MPPRSLAHTSSSILLPLFFPVPFIYPLTHLQPFYFVAVHQAQTCARNIKRERRKLIKRISLKIKRGEEKNGDKYVCGICFTS